MGRINRSELVGLTLKYFRSLGRNKNGKYAYVDQLNKVCEDIFGVKKLGDKLSHKKSQDKLLKAIKTFDFKSLVAMLADDSARRKLSMLVQLRVAIDKPETTSSERKRAKKTYKKLVDRMISEFEVEKNYETDIISAAEELLKDDDEYDWDYDDDNFESIWGTDEDEYSSSYKKYRNKKRTKPNRLAQLLYGDHESYDDYDDDEDYYDAREDSPIMTKLVDAMVSINNKLDSVIEGSSDDDDDFDEYEPPRRKQQSRTRARPTTTRYRDPISPYSDDDEDWIPENDNVDEDDQHINNNDAMSQLVTAITTLSDDVKRNNDHLNKTEGHIMNSIESVKQDLRYTNAKVETLWRAMLEDDEEEDGEEELLGITPPPNSQTRNQSQNQKQNTAYPIRDSEVKNRSDPRK